MEYIRFRSSMTNRTAPQDSTHGTPDPGFSEAELRRIEHNFKEGLTSAGILQIFADCGVPHSEATLRKYVQLGLLPRSVRIGRKGKHQGSQGIYPVSVVRQIWQIKQMMAHDITIEQIQRQFLFMRSDLEQLERTLDGVFTKLSSALVERRTDVRVRAVTREVNEAKGLGKELISKLESVERRLTAPEVASAKAG
jgi:DNA-binding transcriptional MerR regulator